MLNIVQTKTEATHLERLCECCHDYYGHYRGDRCFSAGCQCRKFEGKEMNNIWICKKCRATDVPMNGKDRPDSWNKCVFGTSVGSYHMWRQLTDVEARSLRRDHGENNEKHT